MEDCYDPYIFRYTVRTPKSRHAAIQREAKQRGIKPDQLVQALFDELDLTSGTTFSKAQKRHEKLFPKASETTKEMAARAASAGLTVRELRVFRILVRLAGATGIVCPSPMEIAIDAQLADGSLDIILQGLLEKGFIAESAGGGRGRSRYRIARMPNL